jgi:hypothetical protein
MKLKDIKVGQVFSFAEEERLPKRGHESTFYSSGKFIYLIVCEGTTPKVYHMDSNQEIILASEVYYKEVTPLTVYV